MVQQVRYLRCQQSNQRKQKQSWENNEKKSSSKSVRDRSTGRNKKGGKSFFRKDKGPKTK